MMKHSTKSVWMHIVWVRLHGLVILSCVVLALVGQVPGSSGGWVSCPPQMIRLEWIRPGRQPRRERDERDGRLGRGWGWIRASWRIPAARSLILWGMWQMSGGWGPGWVVGLPWLVWLWQGVGRLWPRLHRQPEWRGVGWLMWQGQRLALVGYGGVIVSRMLGDAGKQGVPSWVKLEGSPLALGLGLGCVGGGEEGLGDGGAAS